MNGRKGHNYLKVVSNLIAKTVLFARLKKVYEAGVARHLRPKKVGVARKLFGDCCACGQAMREQTGELLQRMARSA
jgi:hypothetical protein